MLYRATNKAKAAWSDFAVSLQCRTIVDINGHTVSKREVFESLFDEDSEDQIQLSLVKTNHHDYYTTVEREDYCKSKELIDHYDKVSKEVIYHKAVIVIRESSRPLDIGSVTAGMEYVLQNQKEIDAQIESKAKGGN